MKIIWYIILWNIKDNSRIPFQMSTQSEVLYFIFFFMICLSINVILGENAGFFFLHIYLNVFEVVFQRGVILPQGKLCEILGWSRVFYNKLRTVQVTTVILLLNQISKVGQDLRETPFFPVTCHFLFLSVGSMFFPIVQ